MKWFIILLCFATSAQAQSDSTRSVPMDRPLTPIGGSTSLGGYAELNSHYASHDGVTEGFTFEFRRFNLFLASEISRHVRFFSELEFEHGAEEIELETAQLDLELWPEFMLRGGILLVPLGRFNQRHDSPRWDFVERPLVSTEVIPSTFSEAGAGILGSIDLSNVSLEYEAYVVNGLRDALLLGPEGRTSTAAGKSSGLFAEDNNGSPAVTGKLTSYLGEVVELGLSGYHGAYNTYKIEGLVVQDRNDITILAFDTRLKLSNLVVESEAALTMIDVPHALRDLASARQYGVFLQASHPLGSFSLGPSINLDLAGALRFDYVDLNQGRFSATESTIYDDRTMLTAAVALRPSSSTVLKLNYSLEWVRDILGNPTRGGAIRTGVASYF